MNYTANYRNLCSDSSVGRGNGAIGALGSPLSVPVPSKNFISFNNFNRFPDQNKSSTQDDDFSVPIDDERMVLNQEMQMLSLNERESSQQTVLGHSANTMSILSRMSQEDEERFFRERKFREFDQAIREIEAANGSARNPDFAAYKLARDIDPTYVNHPLFKIGFLRAEKYDADKAAPRLIRYLAEKLDLFGRDKLTLDVILDDIGDDGKRYLEGGGLHVLPERDMAGRRVIFEIGGLNTSGNESDILCARKAYFYFWTSLAEDDNETGRVKGVVGISWRIHNPTPPDPRCAEAIGKIWQCAPTRISAYHVCYGKWSPSNLFHIMFARMTLTWFKKSNVLRLRRSHYGGALDCMYTLLGEYGCPSQCFPLKYDEDSQMGTRFHKHYVDKWMNYREQVDNEKKAIISSFDGTGFSRFSLTGSVLSNLMSTDSYASNTEHEDKHELGTEIGDSLIGGKSSNNLNYSVPSNASSNNWNSSGPSNAAIRGNDRRSSNGTSSRKYSVRLSDMTMESSATINDSLEQVLEDFRGIDDDDNESYHSSLGNILRNSMKASPIAGDDMLQGSIVTLQSLESMSDEDKIDERNEIMLDCNGKVLIRDCDTEEHILLGRGKPLQKHLGNLWLQNLIAIKFDEYDTLERKMQTRLSEDIYENILSLGRRFLEKSKDHEGYWVEIDRVEAREKLAVSFRTERKRRRRTRASPDLVV